MSLVSRAGADNRQAIQGSQSKGRWSSFCLFAAAALPLDRPPVFAYGPYKYDKCRLLDGSKGSDFVIVAVLLAFIHNASHAWKALG